MGKAWTRPNFAKHVPNAPKVLRSELHNVLCRVLRRALCDALHVALRDPVGGSADPMGGSSDPACGSAGVMAGSASPMGRSADPLGGLADPVGGSAERSIATGAALRTLRFKTKLGMMMRQRACKRNAAAPQPARKTPPGRTCFWAPAGSCLHRHMQHALAARYW